MWISHQTTTATVLTFLRFLGTHVFKIWRIVYKEDPIIFTYTRQQNIRYFPGENLRSKISPSFKSHFPFSTQFSSLDTRAS